MTITFCSIMFDNSSKIIFSSRIRNIFSKNNSQRQFYTTPVTTIPNDQKSFANWLYKTPPTCKENNGNQCVANNYYNLKQNSNFKN